MESCRCNRRRNPRRNPRRSNPRARSYFERLTEGFEALSEDEPEDTRRSQLFEARDLARPYYYRRPSRSGEEYDGLSPLTSAGTQTAFTGPPRASRAFPDERRRLRRYRRNPGRYRINTDRNLQKLRRHYLGGDHSAGSRLIAESIRSGRPVETDLRSLSAFLTGKRIFHGIVGYRRNAEPTPKNCILCNKEWWGRGKACPICRPQYLRQQHLKKLASKPLCPDCGSLKSVSAKRCAACSRELRSGSKNDVMVIRTFENLFVLKLDGTMVLFNRYSTANGAENFSAYRRVNFEFEEPINVFLTNILNEEPALSDEELCELFTNAAEQLSYLKNYTITECDSSNSTLLVNQPGWRRVKNKLKVRKLIEMRYKQLVSRARRVFRDVTIRVVRTLSGDFIQVIRDSYPINRRVAGGDERSSSRPIYSAIYIPPDIPMKDFADLVAKIAEDSK